MLRDGAEWYHFVVIYRKNSAALEAGAGLTDYTPFFYSSVPSAPSLSLWVDLLEKQAELHRFYVMSVPSQQSRSVPS